MHPYRAHINPQLGELLARIGLDKRFVRARGSVLIDADGVEYLDFVSAYGALPFGHTPHEIWEAIVAMRDGAEPSMIQPSYLDAAGELARRLSQLAPDGLDYVSFANSGTEAVEAAIKACRSATGRPGIVATWNGFHGKTFAALSATGKAEYQDGFFAPAANFEHIPYGDAAALEAVLANRADRIAAFIVEPIQGEGGVVMPPAGYLTAVRALCTRHGVLMILDEVQTGLGRTGRLFAAEHEAVAPDVLTLAKALGGGLVPIGAALFNARAFNARYALKHSSTFAGNTLAARVALRVLDLLTEHDQARIAHVREVGAHLKRSLEEIAARYPAVLAGVRGTGLMLGLEFAVSRESFAGREGALIGLLGEAESLTPLIASYLLNVEKIRVVPTLNGKSVIRVQPPLDVTRADADRLVAAVARTCAVLDAGRTDELLGHLIGGASGHPVTAVTSGPTTRRKQVARPGDPAAEGRFAFLVHLLDDHSYAEFDSSLEKLDGAQLTALSERWNGIIEPTVVGSTRVRSASGAEAYGEFIAIQRTAAQIKAMPAAEAVAELEAALEVARSRGARIIGLGGFTSVVSQGGRLLTRAGLPLTTGNSFTTISAMDAIKEAAVRLGLPLRNATATVVGAGGSIGSAAVRLLCGDVGELIMVGNPHRVMNTRFRLGLVLKQAIQRLCRRRDARPLGALAQRLLAHPGCPAPRGDDDAFLAFATQLIDENGAVAPIAWTGDCDAACVRSDVIVTATSATEALINPAALRPGAIICDVSRPANVDASLTRLRPDVLVIDGGVIAVPGLPDLGWSFGFPRGLAYACMCETMMLGLERRYEHLSLGADLEDDTLDLFGGLAAKHGFRLAELRQFGKRVTESDWDRLVAARGNEDAA